MLKVKLLILFVFFLAQANAQVVGSINLNASDFKLNKKHSLTVSLPVSSAQQLQPDFEQFKQRSEIYRFAYPLKIHQSHFFSGGPKSLSTLRFQLNHSSSLAVQINGNLKNVSELKIFNALGVGFTIQEFESDSFITPPISGEELYVEVQCKSATTLTFETLYTGMQPIEDWASAFGSSGNCNINTSCSVAQPYEDQVSSVAMVVVGGTGICSGALINNSCNDATPYFLTANHCLDGNENSWSFLFNWESPTCSLTTNNNSNQLLVGAQVRANALESDFALLEINQAIPDSFNVYFSGWDISGSAPTETFAIHHPSGDIKKISFDYNSPTPSIYGSAQCWQIGSWELGTTEAASSGAPLFSNNGFIVGQLFGGLANCGNTSSDYFGRFDVSWNANTASTQQLETWLGACGSPQIMSGFNPQNGLDSVDVQLFQVLEPTEVYCFNQVQPKVVIRNGGTQTLQSFTLFFQLDNGTISSVNYSGNVPQYELDTLILPSIALTSGTHTLHLFTQLPNGISDQNPLNDTIHFNFTSTIGGLPLAIQLHTDDYGSETSWSLYDASNQLIANDSNFANVVGGEQFQYNFCLDTGCYKFVINDAVGDGMCCNFGNGNYSLNYPITNDVIAFGGDFDFTDTIAFCFPFCANIQALTAVHLDSCGLNTCAASLDLLGFQGGQAPYSFVWENSTTDSTQNQLCNGYYNLTITDNLGCVAEDSIEINSPAALKVFNFIINDDSGIGNGSITLNVQFGTLPYEFSIDSGATFQTSNTFNNLSGNQQYTITVKDAFGCLLHKSFYLGVLPVNEVFNDESIQYSVFQNEVTLESTVPLQKIELYAVNGQLISEKSVLGSTQITKIKLPDTNAIYYLRIFDARNQIKTLKVGRIN